MGPLKKVSHEESLFLTPLEEFSKSRETKGLTDRCYRLDLQIDLHQIYPLI